MLQPVLSYRMLPTDKTGESVMILQTTIALTAAALVINLWHVIRIGRVRAVEKIIHGDGGNALLTQRMRAQSNFIENVPVVLIMIGLVELAEKGGSWLPIVGAVFMLSRVSHVIGMDNPGINALRMIGATITMLTQLGLAIVAILILFGQV